MHFGFLALDYPSAESGGGVGSQIRVLARTLVKAGHRATVVALRENGSPARAQDEGVEIHRVSPGNIHWYLSRIPGMNWLLVTAIREIEYSKAVWSAVRTIQKSEPFDLLEGTETGSVCAALLGRKVPLVIRLHGDPFTFYKYTPDLRITLALRLSRMIQRIALRHSRVLISPSLSHLREISTELHGAHPPIEIIPNAVGAMNADAGATPCCPALAALLEAGGPVVLYVGRIEKCKGVLTLLEAAARIQQAVPDCRFVLAGARHSTLRERDIDILLDRLRIRDVVTFLGHVPHEHLARLYSRATVSVVPSHYETFGLAALESMKFGVPVVAAAAGSLPEIVLDGVTGLLAPPGNAEAMAGAVTRLLTDQTLHRDLSRNARQRAQQYYVDEQVPRNLELYERATPLDLHGDRASEHILFSAHPDDVVLSCGGFVASLVRAQRNVRVITVFANAAGPRESAYSRHLQAKWGFNAERRQEDLRALKALGVERVEQWDFADAPWRVDARGNSLYTSYEELCGTIPPGDTATADSLRSFIDISTKASPSAILYFPLSIGGHVDHRHLFQIGVRLRAAGRRVRFYEDWPYAESYSPAPARGWFWRTVRIDPNDKIEAIRQYESQMPGLGGESDELRRRIRRFTRQRGVRDAAERYWEISTAAAGQIDSGEAKLEPPFTRPAELPRLRDLSDFARTLSWRELEGCLPVGRGMCVDVGCGEGRHRARIEKLGYTWAGFDRNLVRAAGEFLRADCQALPLANGSASAVVAWQVMEYAPQPEVVFSEAARVLESGGVFCGSVSFLEPVHGRTYFGIGPLGLRELLEQNGFKDIRILPGLSAFSLTAWTWMRRFAGPWVGRFALPLAAATQFPLMAMRFLISWIAYRLGLGAGHGMRWVAKDAPLEFAGQLVFVARKAARRGA
jgi:glycosyltransferase involved in cell wall biosynthesis/LmbE family N-acetylglucosaminyl deacetylase